MDLQNVFLLFMHRPEHKMLRIWKYVTDVMHGPRGE